MECYCCITLSCIPLYTICEMSSFWHYSFVCMFVCVRFLNGSCSSGPFGTQPAATCKASTTWSRRSLSSTFLSTLVSSISLNLFAVSCWCDSLLFSCKSCSPQHGIELFGLLRYTNPQVLPAVKSISRGTPLSFHSLLVNEPLGQLFFLLSFLPALLSFNFNLSLWWIKHFSTVVFTLGAWPTGGSVLVHHTVLPRAFPLCVLMSYIYPN